MKVINGLWLFLALLLNAQTSQADNDFIVKIKKDQNPFLFSAQHNVKLTPISADMGLYLAHPQQKGFVSVSMATVKTSPMVEYVQENHPVVLRAGKLLPNDKNFNQQWNWQLDSNQFGVDAVSAWGTYGTGGKDVLGNDIVVGVVDGGFDYKHPDLINNTWINSGEIAGNNIDDDGNGYTDDVNGWNSADRNGTLMMDDHGTHVAGIMGAQGNNGILVTGINWNIKIMYVSAGWELDNTALVLSSYGYILKQKQIWISSGGKKGANVVAINSSFGIDKGNCQNGEYAAWNDMFNELGKAGILSVSATANNNWDIDQVGDVPTSCNSDYLISVTSSEIGGIKNIDAGFGATTIDLAAPGENIFSTLPGNSAGFMAGTSMASPHVTGAIGYLYSAASAALINRAISAPAETALEIKKILLDNVSQRPSLAGHVVSGGILNLNQASAAAAAAN